jgi:hypothetical protein
MTQKTIFDAKNSAGLTKAMTNYYTQKINDLLAWSSGFHLLPRRIQQWVVKSNPTVLCIYKEVAFL